MSRWLFPPEWLEEQRQAFLADQSLVQVFETRGWSERDLDLHLQLPEALRRFAKQRFGPGLEDTFLASRGGRDQVIYSLLRVRDAGLARELGFALRRVKPLLQRRLISMGLVKKLSARVLSALCPLACFSLRFCRRFCVALRPGELSAPRQLGEWHVLMRLEQLKPARFDEAMREQMQQEALDAFLEERVKRVLAGEADSLEPIHYDSEP